MSDHEDCGRSSWNWSDSTFEDRKFATIKPHYPASSHAVNINETRALSTLSSYINSPTSKITVGGKGYHIHHALLEEKAPAVFYHIDAQVLRGEASRIDSWSAAVFDRVVLWLYQDRLEVPAQAGLKDYTDVYRFATRFEIEPLQNQVVDQTRKYCQTFQIAQYVVQEYAGMLGDHIGGQMSKFLIDQLAYEMVFYGNGYESAGSKEDFEVFFEADVKTAVNLTFTLRGFQERKFMNKNLKPSQYIACKYHDHIKTPVCNIIVHKKTSATTQTTTTAVIASSVPSSQPDSTSKTDKEVKEDMEAVWKSAQAGPFMNEWNVGSSYKQDW